MGYTTEFEGSFRFSRQLALDEKVQLDEISKADWRHDRTKPGYFCKWASDEHGKLIEWDGREKFYDYIEWLEWLIKNFFVPKNISLNGTVLWQGEEIGDLGKIEVTNNIVKVSDKWEWKEAQ